MTSVAADLVLLVHLMFILFVAGGGALAIRWPRIAWFHIPAVGWGVWIELTGGICPLTPLENRLRAAAGTAGFDGGFIDHYVSWFIYPPGLTRQHQLAIAVSLIVINLLVYSVAARKLSKRGNGDGAAPSC